MRRPGVPVVAMLVLLVLPACAQRPVLKSGFETEGEAVRRVFTPAVTSVRRSTLRLSGAEDHQPVALGLVVSGPGEVLTKASELRDAEGRPRAVYGTLADGRHVPLVPVAVDPRTDLALLRIDPPVAGLVPLDPAGVRPGPLPGPGRWVLVPGLADFPDAVGIVSTAPRGLDPVRLGIAFFRAAGRGEGPEALVVSGVQDNMGAARAGVRPGDRLLRLDGRAIAEARDLIDPLRDASVGDALELVVGRDGQELALDVVLMNRPVDLDDREDFMNQMGNTLSRRRDGFDAVLQHDATIEPEQCGGPLVDLDGRLLGINIARAGRIESYALPLSEVVAALARLRAAAP